VLSFSGGKDSTAMLLMMLERGEDPGNIVFFETGWEFPEMLEHIERVEKFIGRRIIRLHPKRTFEYFFSDHYVASKGRSGYGFPTIRSRWCTRLKIDAIDSFWLRAGRPVMYIGVAYDEKDRIRRWALRGRRAFPLIDWKVTSEQALRYCYERGFDFGGLYQYFSRVSCWCCPFMRLDELRNLRRYFPHLWRRLMDMQKRSWNKFKPNASVFDLEDRFRREDALAREEV